MHVCTNLVSVILRKIYIIFIYKYWHYNLCQCYFEEDKNFLYFYLVALLQKLPKHIVQISVIMSILLKSHRLSTIPEQLRIGSQSRKCQEIIQWKQPVQKLRSFDVETTSKNPRGKLTDISSILKVESTSKFPSRIDVIISTWNCLSKSILYPRTFHLEFRC